MIYARLAEAERSSLLNVQTGLILCGRFLCGRLVEWVGWVGMCMCLCTWSGGFVCFCVCVFACVPVSECKYLEHNSTFTKYHMVKESYVEDEQPMSPLNMIICFKCFNMFQSKILYASLNVT